MNPNDSNKYNYYFYYLNLELFKYFIYHIC